MPPLRLLAATIDSTHLHYLCNSYRQNKQTTRGAGGGNLSALYILLSQRSPPRRHPLRSPSSTLQQSSLFVSFTMLTTTPYVIAGRPSALFVLCAGCEVVALRSCAATPTDGGGDVHRKTQKGRKQMAGGGGRKGNCSTKDLEPRGFVTSCEEGRQRR